LTVRSQEPGAKRPKVNGHGGLEDKHKTRYGKKWGSAGVVGPKNLEMEWDKAGMKTRPRRRIHRSKSNFGRVKPKAIRNKAPTMRFVLNDTGAGGVGSSNPSLFSGNPEVRIFRFPPVLKVQKGTGRPRGGQIEPNCSLEEKQMVNEGVEYYLS